MPGDRSLVTRDDLERALAEVRRSVRDPRAGLYGPGSVSWKINRESLIMLGGGRAALLQLAHPYVAHGVDQHSATKRDPIGRFRRTFMNVFAMVFGDLDHALESARRVHRIHERITGTIDGDAGAFAAGHRYHANTPEALFWVQATLIDTAVQVYELGLGPLSRADKEQYYREARLFSGLFGIPERVMPRSFAELESYMHDMMASETITVSAPALEIKEFLFHPPRRSIEPLMDAYGAFTAGLLPPRLREQLRFAWGRREERLFRASLALLRRGYPLLPRRLRYFPDYVEAQARLRGRSGPDRFGRAIEKVAHRALGGLLQPSSAR